MLSLLQSSAFVHAVLLVLLLAWLGGSVAMALSDARDTRRRQTGQPTSDTSPPALAPAEANPSEPRGPR
ncbi:MAG TPA: hypothetical protein VGR57_08415 [Ktedonobacterales bacterium]|nr:hypothetical protein [Ktedonobacterales bacterium]